MNGTKDSPLAMFWLGYVVPAILVIAAVVGLIMRRVIFLGSPRRNIRGFTFVVYDHAMQVAGVVLLELAFAIGMIAWFNVANRDGLDHWVFRGLLASICVAACGVVIFTLGCFN